MTQAPTQSAAPTAATPHTIILRPWPKVIFFYPTMIATFLCGFWQLFEGDPAAVGEAAAGAAEVGLGAGEAVGLIFFMVFCCNLMIISFEFSRLRTVAIFFGFLALVFLLLYLGTQFRVLEFIRDLLYGLHIRCSISFYLALGVYFLLLYGGIYINARWNYWEVRHNEIVHHTGFLGDIRRFPSPNLKMTKEISDVFEFLLLGSGRIILYPASEKEAIVLDNILSVNRAEREMKKLLSSIQVEMAQHEPMAPQDH